MLDDVRHALGLRTMTPEDARYLITALSTISNGADDSRQSFDIAAIGRQLGLDDRASLAAAISLDELGLIHVEREGAVFTEAGQRAAHEIARPRRVFPLYIALLATALQCLPLAGIAGNLLAICCTLPRWDSWLEAAQSPTYHAATALLTLGSFSWGVGYLYLRRWIRLVLTWPMGLLLSYPIFSQWAGIFFPWFPLLLLTVLILAGDAWRVARRSGTLGGDHG
jgi:hypothetical protein